VHRSLHGDVCRQHYKYPIACTASVWNIIEAAVNNPKHCNDYAGVLHDMLYMSKVLYEDISASIRLFRVIITGVGRKRYHQFKIVCGPGDNAEPVLTIMLPDED
jgi:hypothetical protein